MRLQRLLQCEMRKEQPVPDLVVSDQFLSHVPIFVRAAAPMLDLFADIDHIFILYHKTEGGAMKDRGGAWMDFVDLSISRNCSQLQIMLRCLTISNSITPPATDAFREFTPPLIGIETR